MINRVFGRDRRFFMLYRIFCHFDLRLCSDAVCLEVRRCLAGALAKQDSRRVCVVFMAPIRPGVCDVGLRGDLPRSLCVLAIKSYA